MTIWYHHLHYRNTICSLFSFQLEDPIKVTDKDLNSSFNYTISGYTFDINSDRKIFTRKSLDRETKPNYELNLTVTDGIHSTSTKLKIKVTDTNDNYPQFSNLMYVNKSVLLYDYHFISINNPCNIIQRVTFKEVALFIHDESFRWIQVTTKTHLFITFCLVGFLRF